MNVLLDTCTFLWLSLGSKELTSSVRAICMDEETERFLSVVSIWEILTKCKIGKLKIPYPPLAFLEEAQVKLLVTELSLDMKSTYRVYGLPDLHKDPFDRMLIAQAIEHSLTILTPDPLIAQYAVRTEW